ncbi:MAG: PleD family two-component system response regulator [Rhodothermales bacterium]
MQESTSTGLWFSPDYSPELSTRPKPAIQLPPAKPTSPHSNIPFNSNAATLARGKKDLKILIWSNCEQGADHLQTELQKTGYSSLWSATTYDDGLQLMQMHEFDFFIIDLSIDGIGTKIVKALRSSTTYKDTPMLICTESQLIQDMLNAMKAGANDLICKPINASLLQKKIDLHSKMRIAA